MMLDERITLRVEGLTRTFGSLRVLDGCDLCVAPGEVVAVTGRSGAGKSTLLRIVAGLDRAFTGTVRGAGTVAMVFQEPRLLPWRTGLENVTLATGADAATARALLAEVGLRPQEHAYPGAMSLGQQRRLAFVRAAALHARTLLLDEPFASLDGQTAGEAREALRRLLRRTGATALIATHDRTDALALCDRTVHLEGGKLRPG